MKESAAGRVSCRCPNGDLSRAAQFEMDVAPVQECGSGSHTVCKPGGWGIGVCRRVCKHGGSGLQTPAR